MTDINNDEIFNLSIPEPCDYCKKDNALLRCNNCKSVYYHDRICQKNHWSKHKLECNNICNKMKSFNKELQEVEIFENRNKEFLGHECCICFDIVHTSPTQLTCSHIFCSACIALLYKQSDYLICCPLCRSTMNQDLMQYTYQYAVIFNRKARTFLTNSELRRHYCELSRIEINKILNFENSEYSESFLIRNINAQLYYLEGNYELSIKESKSIINILENRKRDNDEENVYMDVLSNLIDCYFALDDYNNAYVTITLLYPLCETNIIKLRSVLYNASKCFYGLKKYQSSIDMGLGAVSMNRHYQGVHKYIALSYKSLGDIDKAILVMKRAIRYESYGNGYHLHENQTLLDSFIQDKSNTTTLSTNNNTTTTIDNIFTNTATTNNNTTNDNATTNNDNNINTTTATNNNTTVTNTTATTTTDNDVVSLF